MSFTNFNFTKGNIKNHYDSIIIGCGAIGIFAAKELVSRNKRVLIVESGDIKENYNKQNLNKSIYNRADLSSSIEWGRKRAIGGTTIAWGGQALPFSSSDFEKEVFVGEQKTVRWPFTKNDLSPHYKKVEKYLNVGQIDYNDINQFKIRSNFSTKFNVHLSKWARNPNMYTKHKRFLNSSQVEILYNAHCTSVNIFDGFVKSIKITNDNSKELTVNCDNLIIATGGVESVRFIHLNFPNASVHIGCGFMEHPCIHLGDFDGYQSDLLQKNFGVKMKNFFKYGVRVSLSDDYIKANSLQNASFSLMFETPEEDFDFYREAKQINKVFLSLIKSSNTKKLLKTLTYLVKYRTIYRPNAKVKLVVMLEQPWDKTNNIKLDNSETDIYNQPKMNINWTINDKTIKSLIKVKHDLLKELLINFPSIKFRDNFPDDDYTEKSFSPVNHHMGGASINLVVDENLKLFGTENVYVYSSSVFLTSSHSNPTLTTLALVDRSIENSF